MDSKTKRIAQNTFFMTLRMFFLMIVTFFMSRVVLDKLGVDDFGIYNLISSLAVSFTFFSSALTNATQRFVTIELAKNNIQSASKIFNQHLLVYTIIQLINVIKKKTEITIIEKVVLSVSIIYFVLYFIFFLFF